MSKREVTDKIKNFASIVREHNIPFTRMYIFGSHARGKAKKDSDIDVAIVTKKRTKKFFQTESDLWVLASNFDSRIEPLLLSEKEFKDDSIMAHEIKKSGVRII